MNLAFKAAQGTYVCMVSDDCLLVPGAIKNALAHAERERACGKNIGAVAFYWREWSKEVNYHVAYSLGDHLYVNHGIFLNNALRDVNYVDEENYFFYYGDGDLCLKLWQKGYEVIASPDSYVEHYPHANVGVRTTNYVRYKHDLKNCLKKWEGIFYDPVTHNIGHLEEKPYEDLHNTGEKFRFLHEAVVQENPQLIKPASRIFKVRQQLRWKWHAGVRKIRRWYMVLDRSK